MKDKCHICLTWSTLRKSMHFFSLLLPYVSLSCSRRMPVVLQEVTSHFFIYLCHVLPFLKFELFLAPCIGSTCCFSSQSIVSVVNILYPIIFFMPINTCGQKAVSIRSRRFLWEIICEVLDHVSRSCIEIFLCIFFIFLLHQPCKFVEVLNKWQIDSFP